MRRIYVDPGHGGNDPGAVSDDFPGVQEKNLVLPISQLVRRCLIEKGFDVKISRNADKFVSLRQRVDEANAWNADAFLCVHSNARPSGETRGFEVETYWMKQIELDYARKIHFHLINGMREEYLPNVGIAIVNRGLKTENFMVLRETKMISTLVEVGFVTDKDDVAWISIAGHQRVIGRLLCEAIISYFNEPANG